VGTHVEAIGCFMLS